MVLDKVATKRKLAPRSFEDVFVGYPRDKKGFRIRLSKEHKIICARDVRFINEQQPVYYPPTRAIDELLSLPTFAEENNSVSSKSVEFSPHPNNQSVRSSEPVAMVQEDVKEMKRAPGAPKLLRTGKRGRPRKLFQYRKNSESVPLSFSPEGDIGSNVSDDYESADDDVFVGIAEVNMQSALRGPESNEWRDALECEITNIIKNDTWDIVKATEKEDVVGCRFVLTNKCGPDGKIERRKARLVAKGCSQKYGVNYYETFAPVARLDTVRLVLALSAHFGLTIWQFDVVSAYLNGALDEKVLMKVPTMLYDILQRIILKNDKEGEIGRKASKMLNDLSNGGNACRLKRALYGLKQAGRQWYSKLKLKLLSMGLRATKNEPCLFYGEFDTNLVLLLVYVDDLLIASREPNIVHKFKQQFLINDFDIKDVGKANYCLGLEIHQENGVIILKQMCYI